MASVQKANYNWDTGQTVFEYADTASLPMQSARISGVFSSDLAWKVPIVCPPGNCTFDEFSTIGYCSVCSDMTSELINEDLGPIPYISPVGFNMTGHLYNVKFPSGFGIVVNASADEGSATGADITSLFSLGSAEPGRIDLFYRPYNYAVHQGLVDLLPQEPPHFYFNKCSSQQSLTWQCLEYGAASCYLYPCIKTYSASVQEEKTNGKLISYSANVEWKGTNPTGVHPDNPTSSEITPAGGSPIILTAVDPLWPVRDDTLQFIVDLDCLTPE